MQDDDIAVLARLAASLAHDDGHLEVSTSDGSTCAQLQVRVDCDGPPAPEIEDALGSVCRFLFVERKLSADLTLESPVSVWPDWPPRGGWRPVALVPLSALQFWEALVLICGTAGLDPNEYTESPDTTGADLASALDAVNTATIAIEGKTHDHNRHV